MSRPRANIRSMPEAFESLRNDYAAARSSRFRRKRMGYAPSGSGADYHYRSESDYLRILEYARDMDRNDAIVGCTIDRAVTNAIQCGLSLDPDTGDQKLDLELWNRWQEWAGNPDTCDLAGELTFCDMEALALRHTYVDGDVVALGTRDGQLQMIEAHRIRRPRGTKRNVVNGILLDERRRRIEYWITRDDIDPMMPVDRVNQIRPYPVRDPDGERQIFHVYNPKRISQTRGVSALAPIFDVCGMFEDIQFAKLVQQQIVSCFAIFRKRGNDFTAGGGQQFGAQSQVDLADGTTRVIEGIAPGLELTGYPGEELQGFSPNVPNPEFFPHVKLILTLVGINLGMPLILVLMDGSETNFSGWRGAYDQAKMGFRRNQQWLIRRFHAPTYRWKLRQWIAEDSGLRRRAQKIGAAFFRHRWNTPAWPYVQPLDDAKAADLRVKSLQSSPRRIAGEVGADFDDIARETVEDNAAAIRQAIEAAKQISSQSGEPVSWRDVLFLTGEQKTDRTARAADEPSPRAEEPT